jgi:hypothetical protein
VDEAPKGGAEDAPPEEAAGYCALRSGVPEVASDAVVGAAAVDGVVAATAAATGEVADGADRGTCP